MKRGLFVLVVFIFILIHVDSLLAIGISPPQQRFDFTPNEVIESSFEVINNEDKSVIVIVSFSGGLSQYVTSSVEPFELKPRESQAFPVQLRMPGSFDVPGQHTVNVRAQTRPKEQVGFVASVNVMASLHVDVPYPGTYLNFDYTTHNVDEGEPLKFSFTIDNQGKETVPITNIYVDVYDSEGIHEGTIHEQLHDITPDQKRTFDVTSDTAQFNPGRHTSSAYIQYSGQKSPVINKTFGVGHLFVEILNTTTSLLVDETNPFTMEVVSNWNDPLDGVYGSLDIISLEGLTIKSALTLTQHLQPWAPKILSGYITTNDLLPGNYEGTFTVHYQGESNSVTVPLILIKEEVSHYNEFLIIFIVILIVVSNALWIYYSRKAKKIMRRGREDLINRIK